MNRQELFDTVVDHLRKQNAQSINLAGNCQYRGPNDMKCAVGCLIEDSEYTSEMEGYRLSDLLKQGYFFKNFTFNDSPLLRKLQYLHDDYTPDKWESGFEDIAKEFGLEYSVEFW